MLFFVGIVLSYPICCTTAKTACSLYSRKRILDDSDAAAETAAAETMRATVVASRAAARAPCERATRARAPWTRPPPRAAARALLRAADKASRTSARVGAGRGPPRESASASAPASATSSSSPSDDDDDDDDARIPRAEALRRTDAVLAQADAPPNDVLRAIASASDASGLPPERCVWVVRLWGHASRRWSLPEMLAALRLLDGADAAELIRLVGRNGAHASARGIYREVAAPENASWRARRENAGGATLVAMAWTNDATRGRGDDADAMWEELHEMARRGDVDVDAIRRAGGGGGGGGGGGSENGRSHSPRRQRAEVFALEIASKSRKRPRAAAEAYDTFRNGEGDGEGARGGGGGGSARRTTTRASTCSTRRIRTARCARLLPIRPRSRGERRSLRTFPGVTLHPRFPFNV